MPTAEHVRFWGQSGPPRYPSPMSANDPKRTSHPSMGRRERRDEGLEMTYRGHRQHQQPTSDDKTSADYARHEMSPDGFLHEHKRRNSRHPEHVHHATNEQQRH